VKQTDSTSLQFGLIKLVGSFVKFEACQSNSSPLAKINLAIFNDPNHDILTLFGFIIQHMIDHIYHFNDSVT
jgi:hypothetical protein